MKKIKHNFSVGGHYLGSEKVKCSENFWPIVTVIIVVTISIAIGYAIAVNPPLKN